MITSVSKERQAVVKNKKEATDQVTSLYTIVLINYLL